MDIYSVLRKFGINTPNYITIQTGSGRCWENIKNETRQWPEEYYRRFVKLLKEKYPEVQIIQIGSKKQSPISGVDIDLRDQTDMEEAFSLLKHARLHISQEGGRVHARLLAAAHPLSCLTDRREILRLSGKYKFKQENLPVRL